MGNKIEVVDGVRGEWRSVTKAEEVKVGQRVARGDLLAEVDLDSVRAAQKDPTTILVVTNTASLTAVVPVVEGTVSAGDAVVEIDH